MANMFLEPSQRSFIVEFAIEISVQAVNGFKAVNVFNSCLVRLFAYILHSKGLLPVVINPASFACCQSAFCSSVRPRRMRERTVPGGTPRISAVSSYERPSMLINTTVRRNDSGRRSIAATISSPSKSLANARSGLAHQFRNSSGCRISSDEISSLSSLFVDSS